MFKIEKVTANMWRILDGDGDGTYLGNVVRNRDPGCETGYAYTYRKRRDAPALEEVREAVAEDPSRGQRDWNLIEID